MIPESESLILMGSRFHINTLLESMPWYWNLWMCRNSNPERSCGGGGGVCVCVCVCVCKERREREQAGEEGRR